MTFFEDGARYNPEDPFFSVDVRGFESYSIRKWRGSIERSHMAAEGIVR